MAKSDDKQNVAHALLPCERSVYTTRRQKELSERIPAAHFGPQNESVSAPPVRIDVTPHYLYLFFLIFVIDYEIKECFGEVFELASAFF
jgi:hypothetical protein